MPTNTFFRLPEEKRNRLMDAAWAEFSQHSFAEASINQIVQGAGISRGSFYQYFRDKEDLFYYLIGGTRDHFLAVLCGILADSGGDLFAVPMGAFDRLVQPDRDPWLERFLSLMRVNQGMDKQHFLCDQQNALPDALWEAVDCTRLRRDDRPFVEQIFSLVLVCTATAILAAIAKPENRDHERRLLADRVEVLAYGGLKQDTLTQEEKKR